MVGISDYLKKERDNLAEEYIRQIREKCYSGDTEGDHSNADDIVCALLCDLGYGDVVKEYENVHKWYA